MRVCCNIVKTLLEMSRVIVEIEARYVLLVLLLSYSLKTESIPFQQVFKFDLAWSEVYISVCERCGYTLTFNLELDIALSSPTTFSRLLDLIKHKKINNLTII